LDKPTLVEKPTKVNRGDAVPGQVFGSHDPDLLYELQSSFRLRHCLHLLQSIGGKRIRRRFIAIQDSMVNRGSEGFLLPLNGLTCGHPKRVHRLQKLFHGEHVPRSAFTHYPLTGYVVVSHALASKANWTHRYGADPRREDSRSRSGIPPSLGA
jgi:hypothetical protein